MCTYMYLKCHIHIYTVTHTHEIRFMYWKIISEVREITLINKIYTCSGDNFVTIIKSVRTNTWTVFSLLFSWIRLGRVVLLALIQKTEHIHSSGYKWIDCYGYKWIDCYLQRSWIFFGLVTFFLYMGRIVWILFKYSQSITPWCCWMHCHSNPITY